MTLLRALAWALSCFALLALPLVARAADADEERPAQETARVEDTNSLFREAAGPLGLTPDQRERLHVISGDSREQAAPIRAELQSARERLKALLDEEEPDFASVMAQIETVGAAETRMRKHQIATLLALRAVLSAEQREGLISVLRDLSARDESKGGAMAAKAVPTAMARDNAAPDGAHAPSPSPGSGDAATR